MAGGVLKGLARWISGNLLVAGMQDPLLSEALHSVLLDGAPSSRRQPGFAAQGDRQYSTGAGGFPTLISTQLSKQGSHTQASKHAIRESGINSFLHSACSDNGPSTTVCYCQQALDC